MTDLPPPPPPRPLGPSGSTGPPPPGPPPPWTGPPPGSPPSRHSRWPLLWGALIAVGVSLGVGPLLLAVAQATGSASSGLGGGFLGSSLGWILGLQPLLFVLAIGLAIPARTRMWGLGMLIGLAALWIVGGAACVALLMTYSSSTG